MKSEKLAFSQFQARFPTDDSCLDYLFQTRYGFPGFKCPKCKRPAKYSRVKTRRSYQCSACANQIFPTAGTLFDHTGASLRDWFYVVFLFVAIPSGVDAKLIQRAIGVSYKKAWDMCQRMRNYMPALGALEGNNSIGCEVEIVEFAQTVVGGLFGKRIRSPVSHDGSKADSSHS
jgi:transposase-like protein